ncbi:hypothetical protein Alches_12110 [Alicyclobacillus hesperidum subsp. aegles]|nr:hypothetical protein Alches_12110 [Alicyclobacillus hesperidum subsp. aegles]
MLCGGLGGLLQDVTFLTGANVGNRAQLQDWHVDTVKVRNTLLQVYLKQILETGFVHIDLYPGSSLVQTDGKLALLDFGMVAEYSKAERKTFRRLIQSVFLRDALGVVEDLQELGYLPAEVNPAEWLRDIGPVTGRLNANLIRRLRSQQLFRLQARYMLLIRCLGLLKSVLTELSPNETDWLGVMSEHALPILMGTAGESAVRA